MTADVRSVADPLRRLVRGRVAASEPMAPLTSLRVGGSAALFVEPVDEDDLERAAAVLGGLDPAPEVLVVGRGSNLLVSDRGFPGVVVHPGPGFEWIEGLDAPGAGGASVQAGGGTPLPKVGNWAARRSLAGLEFAVAIPGSVGGGVRMNAGAHGSSVGEVLAWARVLRLASGARETLAAEALRFSYRGSAVGPTDVVCAAGFRLEPGRAPDIAARMEAYRLHRSETQPTEAANAGSMFRNPSPPGEEPGTAGYLIETAGLKGATAGRAEVSRLHANFFLARAGATAQDVHDLMVRVQRAVEAASGVVLVPEIRLVGVFDGAGDLRTGA
jgi:UDP-N-acetylmuramate dehydrogenase